LSQNLFGELTKHLIDTDLDEENEVQNTFYELLLPKLLKIFDDNSLDEKVSNAKNVICDIIMFCTKQQIKRIKDATISLDLVGKVFKVFATNDKFIILMAIQIFKLLLLSKDDSIYSMLCKPLDQIIAYFMTNCKKKRNLMYSAIMDIFNILIKEDITQFIKYMDINHQQFLKDPSFTTITTQIESKIQEINSAQNQNDPNKIEETELTRLNKNIKDLQQMMTSFIKKNKPNLTIISPFGSTITPESNPAKSFLKPGQLASSNGGGKFASNSSSSHKSMEYEDDIDYMYEANIQKDNNHGVFEDIQMKKRKLDENGAYVKIINNSS